MPCPAKRSNCAISRSTTTRGNTIPASWPSPHAGNRPVQESDEAVDPRKAVVVVGDAAIRGYAFAGRQSREVQMPAVHLVKLEQRPDRRRGWRVAVAPLLPRPSKGIVGDALAGRQRVARNLCQLRQLGLRRVPLRV